MDVYLLIVGVVSVLILPALTIVLFQRWPYVWWLLWCLSLAAGLDEFFEHTILNADSDANFSRGILRAFGLVLISSNVVSLLIFLFRKKIRTLIPQTIQRSVIIFVAALILVFSIVVPLGRLLKI
jgi:hypothetical protein